MTRKTLILVASGGSLALLLGAFAFQYIGGMAPCTLCLWQRWPHGVAVLAGVLALALPGFRLWVLIGALGAATSGAIGVFHAGVEQKWWPGLSTCSAGGDIANLTPDQLLEQIIAAPVVRCDDIPWQMLGVSMAGWNALISFALALIWVLALTRRA